MSDCMFKRVSVIGLGYIGLPTAAMFASRNIEVVGVDVNQKTVDIINQGRIHIHEPGLAKMVHDVFCNGRLRATTVPESADAFLIAVPTPFAGASRAPDLSYVEAATKMIAPVLRPGNIVILESTSPPGTTEKMAEWLAESRMDLTFPQTAGDDSDIRIAYCPERVLPGKVMEELVANDRIIGGMTATCSVRAAALYKIFVEAECVVASGPRLAEMAKLTENSFRDVNIAFANELSLICDELDLDVWDLISLANRHPRVNVLQAGPGVGGHCIAVDPWFVVSAAPEQARLIRTAREVNDRKPEWVLRKTREAIGAHLMANPDATATDVRIVCYGLTFKSDIDDLRESPALDIARKIAAEHKGPLLIVEPNVTVLPSGLENAEFVALDKTADADIHVMLVDHTQFKTLDAPSGRLVDTRGVWSHKIEVGI